MRVGPWLVALPILGLVPLAGLLGGPAGELVADPASEWPVKLWVFETFVRVGWLGGRVDSIGFPAGGPLNNPDPVGTLVSALLRPPLGRAGAWNALLWLQTTANLLAAWSLARRLVADRGAALFGAACFALTPMVLVYATAGAVTDLLNLWPYPLALGAGLDAVAGGPPRRAAAAGAWAVVGYLTCPYNFVVFGIVAVPLLFALPLLRAGPSADAAPPPPWRTTLRALALTLLVLVPGASLVTASTWAITHAPDSLIPQAAIDATRHQPPWPSLRPTHPDRYVARLVDYVATGPEALQAREAGSRYLRAWSFGWTALLLAAFAVGATRRVGAPLLWGGIAALAAAASTGPWLPVDGDTALPGPWNPAWHLARRLPGGALILEPFRYALPAALGVAMAAAFGVDALARRAGAWVGPVALLAWLAELVLLSPVPFPLPTTRPEVPAIYARLDELVGPGAVLELPFFERGGDRFRRVHFLHQLVHHRPIADHVLGMPAGVYVDNQFVAALVAAEKPDGRLRVRVTEPGRVESDRARLVRDGFAAVVVDESGYATEAARDRARELLGAFGAPVEADGRRVYRLVPVPGG